MSNTSGTSTSVPLTLTLNPTPSLTARDENDIREAILTTLQADFAQNGITVNVLPGSDYYILATAFARQCAVTEANAVVQVDNFMPDSTQSFAVLGRYMALKGLAPRAAFGAAGVVTIACSAPSPISVGQQLTDVLNQIYQVTQAGTYANGAQVPVQAVSTGAATEHVNGDVLTWVIAPPFCSPTVTAGTTGAFDGIVNGGDAEDIESARARYLQLVANPMGGGNAAQVAAIATQASGAVCGATVYSAANGPATCHVACFGYATNLAASNAKNRDIASTLMTGTIAPYIQGQFAEYAEVVVTTVANSPTDVAFGLTLPSAPTASPAGPGGGWVDGSPWPVSVGVPVGITGLTSTTSMICSATTPPVVGSSIAFLDPTTWIVYSAHVVTFSGTSGAYAITLDAPLINIALNSYIWPQSQNQQTYVNAVLGAFAAMGPGEKTNAAGLLPRALRKPLPNILFPYSLNDVFLKVLTNAGSEVLASSFIYTSQTTPAVPGAIASPPNILTPRNISFYAV
jgi:uncharacterized phage protein gp47/JayE